MDGNGRRAQRRGLPRIEGHRHGVASVRRTTEEAARLGIDQLTLYCLSSENWKRPQAELDFLMHLLEQYLIEERTTLMDENIRLAVIGSREGIPDFVLREMQKTIEMTGNNTGMTLCLAVNYGSRGKSRPQCGKSPKKSATGVWPPTRSTRTRSLIASTRRAWPSPICLFAPLARCGSAIFAGR